MAENNVIQLTKQAESVSLPGSGGGGFGGFLSTMMSGIMAVAAVLTLLYLIWGALEWITSGGEKSKVEVARNKITQAIVGLLVLAATTALFMVLQGFLGICLIDFGSGCGGSGPSFPGGGSPVEGSRKLFN